MKAAVLVEPGRIEIREVADPEPGPGEVLISVEGVGICGSDHSVFSGKWAAPEYPWIMGHEAFGVIEAVGEGVSDARIGERVVIEPNVACFECEQCRMGRTSACTGRQSVGMNRPGALAERLAISERFAWKAPDVGEDDLVCVEPTTVAMAGLRRLGDRALDRRVLVVGVGALGLMVVMALNERGSDVAALDINAERLAMAQELGAGPVFEDERFDTVIDTVGSPGSVTEGFEHLAVGGTLMFLGLDNRPMPLDAQSVVRRQAKITGSLTYDHPGDFEHALELIGRGFNPGRVVTDRHSLGEAQRAFERVGSARGKTWIRVREG